MNNGQEGVAQFLVASRHPTELFQLLEEALHFLTSLVLRSVIYHGYLDPIYQLWQRRAWLKARRKDRGIVAGAAG